MSNVIKFERPPENKPPKPKKNLTPMARRALTWLGIVAAFLLAWAYFTFIGAA
jgi:hypothetical protein